MAQQNPTNFDPDQFKQEILDAVEQLMTNAHPQPQVAQPQAQPGYFQPGYGQGTPMQPQWQPQPQWQQPQQPFQPQQQGGYYQQPQFIPTGPVVNAAPFPQQPQQQAPQPQQQYGLVPVPQPQYPLVPQQPGSIEQMMQAILILLQRQEELIMQMQNGGRVNVVNAPDIEPYPYSGDRVDKYRWLIDYGLEHELDGTRRSRVLHRHVSERKQMLRELEKGMSFSEYCDLVSSKHTGILFNKY